MGINIGISGIILNKNRRGFEIYLRQLLESLIEIDEDFHIYLYTDKQIDNIESNSKITQRIIARKLNNFIWKNFQLPFHVIRDKIDVFHFPDNSVWLFPFVKTVVTLHDISPVLCKENKLVSSWMLFLIRFIYFLIRINTRIIITDSLSSKKDIDRYFCLKYDKVNHIPLSYDEDFRIDPEIRNNVELGIGKGFVLYVGGIDRRKNIIKLVEAINIIRNKRNMDVKLVIVGEYKQIKGMSYLTESDIISDDKIKEFVFFTGFTDKRKLIELYNNASVFVLPSLYEGFGLTVLEAMSCGVPVVVSDMEWGHEITGGNALFADPKNAEDIAEKILCLLNDKELADKLIKSGLEHIKNFSWKDTARKTLEIYKKVAQ